MTLAVIKIQKLQRKLIVNRLMISLIRFMQLEIMSVILPPHVASHVNGRNFLFNEEICLLIYIK